MACNPKDYNTIKRKTSSFRVQLGDKAENTEQAAVM